MSGGDGRDHNSGAHNTGGNINGGPTGLGGNGGASDGSGWSSENNPWGGGSGNGNGGGNGNYGGGSNSSVAAPMAFGFPALAAPGAGNTGYRRLWRGFVCGNSGYLCSPERSV